VSASAFTLVTRVAEERRISEVPGHRQAILDAPVVLRYPLDNTDNGCTGSVWPGMLFQRKSNRRSEPATASIRIRQKPVASV
jgi:hypothetical protein